MPRLTEYELERQARIEQNRQLLKSMGLLHAEVAPSKKPKVLEKTLKENNNSTAKKRSRVSDEPTSLLPRRKSARLTSSSSMPVHAYKSPDNLNSDPIDFLSGPSHLSSESPSPIKRVIRLRQLSPPRLPEASEDSGYDPEFRAPLPFRRANGTLIFEKVPHFTPNMTPEDMMRAGSFGGTAFREHFSSILRLTLPPTDHAEFPPEWYAGLDVQKCLTSAEYNPKVNRYRVKAGQSLDEWEQSGWIHKQDPRGWFQWYCRFYVGRRTRDDERQIRRWLGVCGPSGRFKRSLVKKIAEQRGRWDDESIAPILRQTLQHWGYCLTKADYDAYFKVKE